MRIEQERAYILHTRSYRETSLLLDVFTRDQGRVSLVARGVRRHKSGQSVYLQPFRRLSISWSARGELGTMTAVEPEGAAVELPPEAVMAGFYVNELIVRLLHRHEAHPELFRAYEAILERLEDERQREHSLRYFELDLLEAIGFGLVLDHDVVTGQAIRADEVYQYVSERGPSAEQTLPGDHARVCGRTLAELALRNLVSETGLREAKQLLRQEIAAHLGGRPLASRALYQSYLRHRSG